MKKTLVLFIATMMSFSVTATPAVQWGVETGVAWIEYVDYYETYELGFYIPAGVGGYARSIDIDYYDSVLAVLTPVGKFTTIGAGTILVTTGYRTIIDYDLMFNATDNVFLSSGGGAMT